MQKLWLRSWRKGRCVLPALLAIAKPLGNIKFTTMRVPLLLLISLILVNCSTNRRTLTDLDKIGLKGQVRYTKFSNQPSDGYGELISAQNDGKGTSIENEFFFDENGMISEQRQYSSNELSLISVFKYDKNLRLISKEYFNSSHELLLKSKFENILNDKGKITKQLEFRAMENSLVDSTRTSYQKSPYETMEFSYNEKGNLNQLTYIQSVFGPSFPKNVIEFKSGIVDKQLTVDTDGNVIRSNDVICMEFDKNGNCLKLKTMDNGQTEEYTNAEIRYYR